MFKQSTKYASGGRFGRQERERERGDQLYNGRTHHQGSLYAWLFMDGGIAPKNETPNAANIPQTLIIVIIAA